MSRLLITLCTSRSPFVPAKERCAFFENDPKHLQILIKTTPNLRAYVRYMRGTCGRCRINTLNIISLKICNETLFIYLQSLVRFIPLKLSFHRETIVGRESCDNVQCQVAFTAALLPKPSSV